MAHVKAKTRKSIRRQIQMTSALKSKSQLLKKFQKLRQIITQNDY